MKLQLSTFTRKLFLFIILFYSSHQSFSQEKAALTKEETINYIQKKFNELIKGSFSEVSSKKYWYCWQQKISIDDNIVEIFQSINNDRDSEFGSYDTKWTAQYGANTRFYSCNYEKYRTTIKFNPANITDIKSDPDIPIDSEVGRMIITLSTKSAKIN